ncbi:HDOD domain-containing protein [Endozoicomonas sp. SM1973]|uniref:HDOD domain-containing protein n=1 Tax=Spartinivicinus marinus TaxID=2994442 RepID=A0A853I0V2_9GAMM|nr:HDOD domain-containing protein [Spartinivicinus marinus]MCX4026541.1 HDOD domain-containing protein [Spartinivicinus marinus]NYZ64378.1 HDOD domain-containing protein [Spartinivicinus marinus]
MAIPQQVQQILDNEQIRYRLSSVSDNHEHPPKSATAVSVVLEDDAGQLQIICPRDHMIDLEKMNEKLGRKLVATSYRNMQKLYSNHGLQALPAIPQLTGLPTLVENSLLKNETIYIDSGIQHQYIRVKNDEFKRITGTATYLDITLPLSEVHQRNSNAEDDIQDITNAVENFTSLRIKQRLEQTIEIPPLPETAQKIIQLRVDPNADIRHLIEVVEKDPSLAAQVVSWAASPYYAAPGKIRSIEDAVIRVLGFDLVINLAIGLSLGKTLTPPKNEPEGFTPYWKQAAYCSLGVEAMVRKIPPKQRPELGLAYLAGLLHNFGYLVLSFVFPPHLELINRYREANPHVSYVDIERHVLGVSRDQIGGWLMQIWDMPDEVAKAIRYQNDIEYVSQHAEYAYLLYIASQLLCKHGIGEGMDEPIPENMYETLSLTPGEAEEAISSLIEKSEAVENLYKSFNSLG